MNEEIIYILQGPAPFGLTISGGSEFNLPLVISNVKEGGKGDVAGINDGMHVLCINNIKTDRLTHSEAVSLIKNAILLTLSLIPFEDISQTGYIDDNKNISKSKRNIYSYGSMRSKMTDSIRRSLDSLNKPKIKNTHGKKWYKEFISNIENKRNTKKYYLKKSQQFLVRGISKSNPDLDKDVNVTGLNSSSFTPVNYDKYFTVPHETILTEVGGKNENYLFELQNNQRELNNLTIIEMNEKCVSIPYNHGRFGSNTSLNGMELNEFLNKINTPKIFNSVSIESTNSNCDLNSDINTDKLSQRCPSCVNSSNSSSTIKNEIRNVNEALTKPNSNDFESFDFDSNSQHSGREVNFDNVTESQETSNICHEHRKMAVISLLYNSNMLEDDSKSKNNDQFNVIKSVTARVNKKKRKLKKYFNEMNPNSGNDESNSKTDGSSIRTKSHRFVKKLLGITNSKSNSKPSTPAVFDHIPVSYRTSPLPNKNRKNNLIRTKKIIYNPDSYDRATTKDEIQSNALNLDPPKTEPLKTKKKCPEINGFESWSHVTAEHIPCFATCLAKYTPKDSKGTSIEKGSVIHVLRMIDEKYCEVEYCATLEILLISYIGIVDITPNENNTKKPIIGIGKAITSNDTFSRIISCYNKEDFMVLNSIIDEKWFDVTINNKRGIALREHVQIFEGYCETSICGGNLVSSREILKKLYSAKYIKDQRRINEEIMFKNVMFRCESNQNFKPISEDEIEISRGDQLVAYEYFSDGWGKGFNMSTKKEGVFPAFFTNLILI